MANGEHCWVDVGDGDVDVRVAIVSMRVVDHAESDVASAAGHVEDLLWLA